MRTILAAVASVVLAPSLAAADIPMGLDEPDEDDAREAVQAWVTAAKAGDAKALIELGLFGFGDFEVSYAQRTTPAAAKLQKRCGKVTTATSAKAMKKLLPCLLTDDLKAALATVDVTAAGSYAATFDGIPVTSPELKAAARALKKLDDDHAFWVLLGSKGGVTHMFVLAVSKEFASSSPQVGAVIHGISE